MLSKRVLDALREEFHEEFGELSERDDYIQRMKADAFALIGSMVPNDKEFIYGVDARCNAGYGLWQLAFGSTGEADMPTEA